MFSTKIAELIRTAWASIEEKLAFHADRMEARQDQAVASMNEIQDWLIILADQQADRVAECFERRLGEHKGKVTNTALKALVRQAVQDAQQGK